jgi:hypothetical protein
MLRLQDSSSDERDLSSIRALADPCEAGQSDAENPIRKTLKWLGRAAQRKSPMECRRWSRMKNSLGVVKKKRYSFS